MLRAEAELEYATSLPLEETGIGEVEDVAASIQMGEASADIKAAQVLRETIADAKKSAQPAEMTDAMSGVGAEKLVGLTSRLNRAQLRQYLSKVHSYPREQLVNDLKSVGLKIKGQGRGGEFMEFLDKQGRVRVKIHPPARSTPYSHTHLYDKSGRPLSSDLTVVSRKSVDAHIEIKPLSNNSPQNSWRPE